MTLQFSFNIEAQTRVSHSSVQIKGNVLYLFGETGKQENREYLNNALRYDTSSGSLSLLPVFVNDKPAKQRASHTSSPISYDSFMCFGGNYHLELMNEVIIGKVPDKQFSSLSMKTLPATPETPCHRRGHAAVALGDTHKVFIMGGNSQESCLNDCHIFDANTGKWICVSPPINPGAGESIFDMKVPGPRTNHSIIALAPGGGGMGTFTSTLSSTTLNSTGIGTPSCVLLYGGQYTRSRSSRNSQGTAIYDDTWIFDLRAEKWHRMRTATFSLCSHPGKRAGHTLSPIWNQPSSALLFGGGPDVVKMQMCNDAYILDLRMNAYLPHGSNSTSQSGSSGLLKNGKEKEKDIYIYI